MYHKKTNSQPGVIEKKKLKQLSNYYCSLTETNFISTFKGAADAIKDSNIRYFPFIHGKDAVISKFLSTAYFKTDWGRRQ